MLWAYERLWRVSALKSSPCCSLRVCLQIEVAQLRLQITGSQSDLAAANRRFATLRLLSFSEQPNYVRLLAQLRLHSFALQNPCTASPCKSKICTQAAAQRSCARRRFCTLTNPFLL